MNCPFRYRRQQYFSTIVSGDYMDFMETRDDEAERAYNAAYPTCWAKFMHWLGVR